MRTLSAASRGQNKDKSLFFVFRSLLLLPLLFVVVFCIEKICWAEDSHLIINEIQVAGKNTDDDFIELYNPTDKKINLKDYRLVKRSKGGTADSPIKSWASDTYIQSKDYYLWANSHNDFSTSLKADASTGETISKDNGIALKNKTGDSITDSVGWGVCQNAFIENLPAFSPSNSRSIERKNFQDTNNNSADFIILEIPTPTPSQLQNNDDEENVPATTDQKPDYLDQIKINEIYPAPNTKIGEKEFVEIENSSGQEIDFSAWCLKDKTENAKGDSGSCKKIDRLEKTDDFSVFYGTFSLNNDSKGDAVFLYDNNKILIDSRDYVSPKAGHAFAFDGTAWRWTSLATPGKENQFDKVLSGKIVKDKAVYKDIYAAFEVESDRDAQKFTWDFGDGHKSYLQKTRHKYVKTGDFNASLKITGAGEDAIYDFVVNVKKYAAPKIRLVSLSPNPKGNDTENEWIEIENRTKKKINLKGWSIATGWDNLVNHPIREDFFIKAGRIKKLLHDICAFTLTNVKDRIELRDPSGKAVQKIEYDHGKKSIQEEALYQKKDSGDWEWSEPVAAIGADFVSTLKTGPTPDTRTTTSAPIPEIPTADLGKYSIDPVWQKKQDYRIELANFDHSIKTPAIAPLNQPRVLGASTISSQENYYTFTESIPQKHWAATFLETIWLEINSGMNRVLNVI